MVTALVLVFKVVPLVDDEDNVVAVTAPTPASVIEPFAINWTPFEPADKKPFKAVVSLLLPNVILAPEFRTIPLAPVV